MFPVAIREYRPADRGAVRHIAFETAFLGESIEWLWRDRESFADMVCNYYTDREPESLTVVEREGVVVGYLMGCVDSTRSNGSVAREIRRLVARGYLFVPGVAPFLWRSCADLIRDRAITEEVLIDPRWPAHLHINLLSAGRGGGVGRILMNQWIARLQGAGTPGVHLSTFAENRAAISFFESFGFARHGAPIRSPGFRTRDGHRMHVQRMVRSLA